MVNVVIDLVVVGAAFGVEVQDVEIVVVGAIVGVDVQDVETVDVVFHEYQFLEVVQFSVRVEWYPVLIKEVDGGVYLLDMVVLVVHEVSVVEMFG